jgi:hypothetical protein
MVAETGQGRAGRFQAGADDLGVASGRRGGRNLPHLALPDGSCAITTEAGLTAVLDADVERFFALYADNVHRHGTPAMPKRYFAALLDEFGPDAEVLLSDAFLDGYCMRLADRDLDHPERVGG